MLLTWLGKQLPWHSLSRRRAGTGVRRLHSFRPLLEILEDRTVLTGSMPTLLVPPLQVPFSAASQPIELAALLTSSTGPVNDGTVTFSVFSGATQVGPTTAPAAVFAGHALAPYTLPGGTAVGTYTVDASYSGSPAFQAVSGSGSLEVTAGAPTATVVNSNPNVTFSSSDQPVTLSATVTGPNGPVNAGTMTFTVFQGGTPVGSPAVSGSVSNGTATASYTLPGGTALGSYSVVASYSGDPTHQTSTSSGPNNGTLSVLPRLGAPTTTVVLPTYSTPAVAPSASDQPVVLRALVSSPGGGVNEGTVTFTVFTGDSLHGFTQLGQSTTAPVGFGGVGATAGAIFTLPGGSNANNALVVASYSGGPDFQASTSSGATDGFIDESNLGPGSGVVATTTTVAPNPTVPYSDTDRALPFPLQASVTAPGVTMDAGTVTYVVFQGQTVFGDPSGPTGFAHVLPGRTPPGTYTVLAEYSGGLDSQGHSFAGSFGEGTLTVTGVATQTTVTSVAPASFSESDQQINLAASVTSSTGTVQGGTVTFTVFNGATQIGQPAVSGPVTEIVGSGMGVASASFTLPGGTHAGTYTVVATFNGVAQFTPSTSSGSGDGTLIVARAFVSIKGNDSTAPFSTSDQTVSVSGVLSSPAGPVDEGTANFTVFHGGISVGGTQVGLTTAPVPVSGGSATGSYTLPGGTSPGGYDIAIDYSGSTDFLPAIYSESAIDTPGTLTVTAPVPSPTRTDVTGINPGPLPFNPIEYKENDQDVALTALVSSQTGPVNEGTVTFTVETVVGSVLIGQPVVADVGSDGTAAATYTIPGGTPADTYIVVASYSGGPDFESSMSSGAGNGDLIIDPAITTTVVTPSPVVVFSRADQIVTLSAQVQTQAGPVFEGEVGFKLLQNGQQIGQLTAPVAVQNSTASATYTLPGDTAPGSYTIVATYYPGPDFEPSISDGSGDGTLTVTPFGAPDHLAFQTAPVATQAGANIPIVVEVLDSNGNLVSNDDTGSVSLMLNSNAFATGSTTASIINGLASFSGLSINVAATGYTVAATGPVTGTTSAPFDVSAASPDHLAFLTSPGNGVVNIALSPGPVVEVLDRFGNLVTNDNTDTVLLGLAANPTGATLGGTLSQQVSGGLATFNDLTLDRAGSGYQLSASTTGLGGATSVSFNVTYYAVVGNVLYLGANTSGAITIDPVGASNTGSSGIQVDVVLDGFNFNNLLFLQPLTTIYVVGMSGNTNIQIASTLTLATVIREGDGNDNLQLGTGDNTITLGDGNDHIQAGNGNNSITAGNGNDHVQLGDGNNTVTLGGGNDQVNLGNGNNNVVFTGTGNDQVQAGDGNNNVTLGNGNVNVTVGNGNNVVVGGTGNNTIRAGNGDNLLIGGLGHDRLEAGNGSDILIDGSVNDTVATLDLILSEWAQNGSSAANVALIRSQFGAVAYNSTYANTLQAGRGLDWFWATYAQDKLDNKPTDLLN